MGNENKLSFAPVKTKMVMQKGELDDERPPRVYMGGVRIQSVTSQRYLGVTLSKNLDFRQHCRDVSGKATEVMSKLAGAAKANWGMSFEVLRAIYRGVFEAMVTYGSACLADTALGVQMNRKNLLRAQRAALLTVT